jgi:hypothetical protein
MRAILFTGESIVNHFFFTQGIPENAPLPRLITQVRSGAMETTLKAGRYLEKLVSCLWSSVGKLFRDAGESL